MLIPSLTCSLTHIYSLTHSHTHTYTRPHTRTPHARTHAHTRDIITHFWHCFENRYFFWTKPVYSRLYINISTIILHLILVVVIKSAASGIINAIYSLLNVAVWCLCACVVLLLLFFCLWSWTLLCLHLRSNREEGEWEWVCGVRERVREECRERVRVGVFERVWERRWEWEWWERLCNYLTIY